MAKERVGFEKSTVIDLVKNKESRFIKKIFENVWVKARTDQIPQYYSSNTVLHYGDGIFNINMLRKKIIETYHAHQNRHFLITDAFSINDLYIVTITECGIEIATKKPFILNVVTIGRIKDEKVQELWVRYNAHVNLANMKNYISFGDYVATIRKNEYQRMFNIISAFVVSYNLSKRELECLVDLLNGYTAKETAARFKLSYRTVESYIEMIKTKMGCLNKQDLKEKIFPHGLWL